MGVQAFGEAALAANGLASVNGPPGPGLKQPSGGGLMIAPAATAFFDPGGEPEDAGRARPRPRGWKCSRRPR